MRFTCISFAISVERINIQCRSHMCYDSHESGIVDFSINRTKHCCSFLKLPKYSYVLLNDNENFKIFF